MSVQRVVGDVVRVGECYTEGRGQSRVAIYEFIVVANEQGQERIEGLMLVGEAATCDMEGRRLDMLCSSPITHMKRTHFGGKLSTMVYAVRSREGDWLGGDVVGELAKARGRTNWQVLLLLGLAPVAAVGTFFAAGMGGLLALWYAYKARRIAKTLPTRGQVMGAYKAVTTAAF